LDRPARPENPAGSAKPASFAQLGAPVVFQARKIGLACGLVLSVSAVAAVAIEQNRVMATIVLPRQHAGSHGSGCPHLTSVAWQR
jgi:hypothetical protein